MKKLILLTTTLVLACNASQKTAPESPTVSAPAQVTDPVTYAATITEEELKEHLYTYASDEFEGRETGTEGQKKAVTYLNNYYVDQGIPAAKGNGDYLQDVPLEMRKLPEGGITIGNKAYTLGEDFLAFNKFEGDFDEIVYAGYGIQDSGYSDYDNLDVDGKLVLVKFGEPKNEDGTYKVSGTNKKSVWSNQSEAYAKRAEVANENGAVGLLYWDDDNYGRYTRYFRFMKNNDSGQMSIQTEEGHFAMVLLNKDTALEIYPEIEANSEPATLDIPAQIALQSENSQFNSENVVAFIKGSSLPDEYIIISSHLDHIGITQGGEINNGADDDGSGTVALLEIAEAFKTAADAGNGPKRSVVFLHVTGEEKGLLGSQYYTDNDPVFPLNQTVANLNIDMIGRIDPKREGGRNYVYLIGSDKLSTDLHELSEEINKKYMNIELDYTYNDENDPNRFYYRSDHYNFAKNNIPIIFYFNGTHDDYHRPSDTPDKINYDLLQNRARLIFHTAWEIANRPNRVVVDKPAK